ncbi:MAG: VWA domain-containing protein [Planctomycetota bacterium]|nr:MAG: VWA domain-containing protein [Planctomycetota bacterium]
MSWFPGFSAPLNAWLLLLTAPVVLVYFLKLKRTQKEIPSLLLWQQVIADQRVNSPFQRFRKNLLLWLQLALLVLLATAATQPFLGSRDGNVAKLPILIDCSASMGAIDATTKKTRLQLAKDQVLQIIDGLPSGQQLMLIAVHSSAQRLTSMTSNKVELRTALDRLEVADVPSRLEDAFSLASGSVKTDKISTIRLYTDGNVPLRRNPATETDQAVIDFDLPFQVDYFRIPSTGGNVGITSLNATRSGVRDWQVFVRAECSPDAAGDVQLRLIDLETRTVIGEERIVLNPGESSRIVFSVNGDVAKRLRAELTPQGFDALATDNSAWIELPVSRDLLVFCPETLPAVRHALRGMEGIQVEPVAGQPASAVVYDLVISDSLEDLAREATTYLTIGQLPHDLAGKVTIQDSNATVVDWKRDAPLLQHVQMLDVDFIDSPQLMKDVTESNLERLGYMTLCHGTQGPLILERRAGPRLTMHWLFQLDRTTLPYRLAFPIMATNLVNLALNQAELSEAKGPATGILPPVKLDRSAEYLVTNPQGVHQTAQSDKDGWITGIPARRVGPFEFRQGGVLVREMGVSLLNARESSLSGVDTLVAKEAEVSANEMKSSMDRPLWTLLAGGALIVLMVEWWFYQRRPGSV